MVARNCTKALIVGSLLSVLISTVSVGSAPAQVQGATAPSASPAAKLPASVNSAKPESNKHKMQTGKQAAAPGAVQLPLHKPLVDQLGQMKGTSFANEFMLVAGLLIQTIALIGIAYLLGRYSTHQAH